MLVTSQRESDRSCLHIQTKLEKQLTTCTVVIPYGDASGLHTCLVALTFQDFKPNLGIEPWISSRRLGSHKELSWRLSLDGELEVHTLIKINSLKYG